MSKNLFSIPSSIGGKVLSFLQGKEALVFYLMFSILNNTEDFVPKDYQFEIEGRDMSLWSFYKYIKKICIVNPTEDTYLFYDWSHLESFKLKGYTSRIVNLEKLTNVRTLDIGKLKYSFANLISLFKELQDYTGDLFDGEDIEETLNLRSFSGGIANYGLSLVLTKYFNTDKLEELKLEYCSEKTIYSLDKFVNLRKLDIGGVNVLDSLNSIKPLVKLEKLFIRYGDVFDWSVLSTMTNLIELDIYYFSYANVEQLPNEILKGLSKLSINPPGLECIRNRLDIMTNLRILEIWAPDFSILKDLPVNLTSIKFYTMGGDMSDFQYIERLSSLETLKVGFENGFPCSMLKHISKLRNLRKLTLIGVTKTNSKSLKGLFTLPNLKKIMFPNKRLCYLRPSPS